MYQVPVPPVPAWPYGCSQQISMVPQMQPPPEQTQQVQVPAMNHMQPQYGQPIPPQPYNTATAAPPVQPPAPPVQPPTVSSVQPIPVQTNFQQPSAQPNAMPQPNYGQVPPMWCQQNTQYNPWGQPIQQPNYSQSNYWNQNPPQPPPSQGVQPPSQPSQQQHFQHVQNLQPIDPLHPSQQVQQLQTPHVQHPKQVQSSQPQQVQPPQQPHQVQPPQQSHQVQPPQQLHQVQPPQQPHQVQPSQQPQQVQPLEQAQQQQPTQFQLQQLKTPPFSHAQERPPLQQSHTPQELPPPMQQPYKLLVDAIHHSQQPPPVQPGLPISEQQYRGQHYNQWLPPLSTPSSQPSNNPPSCQLNQNNQFMQGYQNNQPMQDASISEPHPPTQQDPRQNRGDKRTTQATNNQTKEIEKLRDSQPYVTNLTQTSIAEKSQQSCLSSSQSIPSSNASVIYTSHDNQDIGRGAYNQNSHSQPLASSRASLPSDSLPTSVLGKPIDPLREPPPPPPPKKSLSSNLHTSASLHTGINVTLSNSPVNLVNDNLGGFGSKHDNQIVQESLASLRVQLETLEKQIKTYQIEYQKWHQDFVKWQKQHQNHPDQKKYIDYQKQYQKMIEEQQSQLKQQYAELQKKINKRKEEQKAAAAVKTASMIISNAASKAAAAKAKADSSDLKNLPSSQQCEVQQSHDEAKKSDNSSDSQTVVSSCNVANVPPPPTNTAEHQFSTSHLRDPPPPPPPPGSPSRSLHSVSTSNINEPPPPPPSTETSHQAVVTHGSADPGEQSTHPNNQQYHSSQGFGNTNLSHANGPYSNDTPYSSDSFQQPIGEVHNVVDKHDNSVDPPCSLIKQSIPLLDKPNLQTIEPSTSITESDLSMNQTVMQNNPTQSKINEQHIETSINEIPMTQSHSEMDIINQGYSQIDKKSPVVEELPPVKDEQPSRKSVDKDFTSPNEPYPSNVDSHSQHQMHDPSVQTENTKTQKDDSLITVQLSPPTSQMHNTNLLIDVHHVRMNVPHSGVGGPSHLVNDPPFHVNPPWLQHESSSQLNTPEASRDGPLRMNFPISQEEHRSNMEQSIMYSAFNSDRLFGNNMPPMQNAESNQSIIKRSTVDFPGKICRFFPRCNMGNKCKFEHPMCKANKNCIDPACPYEHPPGLDIKVVNVNGGNINEKSSATELMKPGPAPKLKGISSEQPAFMLGQFVNGNPPEKKEYPKPAVGVPMKFQFGKMRKLLNDQTNISGNYSQDNPQSQYTIQEQIDYPQRLNCPAKEYPSRGLLFGNTSQINCPENMNDTQIHGSFLRDHCCPPGIAHRTAFPPQSLPLQDTALKGITPRDIHSQDGLQKDLSPQNILLQDFPGKEFPPRNVPSCDGPSQEFPHRGTPLQDIRRQDFPLDFPPNDGSLQDFSPQGVPKDFPSRRELWRDGSQLDHPRDISEQGFPPQDILSRERSHPDYLPQSYHSKDHLIESPPMPGNMHSRVPHSYARDGFLRDNLRDCPPSSSHSHLSLFEGQPMDCLKRDNLSRDVHSKDVPPWGEYSRNHPRDFPQRDGPLRDFPPRDYPHRDLPRIGDLGNPFKSLPKGHSRISNSLDSSQDDYPRNSPRRDHLPHGMPTLPFRGLPQKSLSFGEDDSQDTSKEAPGDIKATLSDGPPQDDLSKYAKSDQLQSYTNSQLDSTGDASSAAGQHKGDLGQLSEMSNQKDAEYERRKREILGIIGNAPEPPRIPEGYRKRDIPPIMGVDSNARPHPAKHSRLNDPMGREYERRRKEILGVGRDGPAVYDHRHGISDIHRNETAILGDHEKDHRFERRISGIRSPSPRFRGELSRESLHCQSPLLDGRFRGRSEGSFRNEMDRNPPYTDHYSHEYRRDRHPYEPVRVTDEFAAKDVYDHNRQLPGYRCSDRPVSMDRVPTLPRFSDGNYLGRDGLDRSKELMNDNMDVSRRYRDLSARELLETIKDKSESDVENSGNTKEAIDDRRDRRGSPYRRNRPNEFDTPNRDFTSEHPRRSESHDHERRDKDKIQSSETSHHQKDRVREMSHKKEQDNKKGKEVPPIDSPRIPISELKPEVFSAADILDQPGRETRPQNIVIILRGIPGSGKSFMAKLIKDKESFYGAQPPRILALDDYFMQEVEKTDKKPGKGNAAFVKKQEYVYEADMEAAYRGSLLKAFNKTLNDGFFPMVIVDAINDKASHFDQFWSDAKHKGFEVFISEISGDMKECMERSVHKRSEEDVKNMLKNWEKAPVYYKQLDVSSLLQDAAIDDVEMEEANEGVKTENLPVVKKGEEEEEDLPNTFHIPKSKWEDSKEETMAKLDGVSKKRTKDSKTKSPIYEEDDEDDPYDEKEADIRLGKKRVRWADLEEKKQIDHQKKIGFSIGMDWKIFTDPNAQIPK